MDLQRNLLLNFTYFHQDNKNMNTNVMDEVRQSLLLNMELEAQAELKLRDQEIAHLKDLLAAAIRDRDEAQEKLILLQQRRHHSTPHSGVSSVEEDHRYNASDCDESIVSSPQSHHLPPPEPEQELPVPIDRPLPEKGKFLQAVMKAGPLLQTLLLAGPLPQWRHPPPPLDTYQIPPPPVVIPSPPTPFLPAHHSLNNHDIFDGNCGAAINRKRGLSEISSHSAINNELKYQRVVLQ